jgi:hypothetical protein
LSLEDSEERAARGRFARSGWWDFLRVLGPFLHSHDVTEILVYQSRCKVLSRFFVPDVREISHQSYAIHSYEPRLEEGLQKALVSSELGTQRERQAYEGE